MTTPNSTTEAGVTEQHSWQSALPSAVLRLNALWNQKAGEEAIAGALDLCRRLSLLASSAGAPTAAATGALKLKACLLDGHDPFVFYVDGMMTARVLSGIDEELTANKDELFKDGQGDYEFTATHFNGQYGFEGRCELAPGWEFEQTGFTPLAVTLCDRCNGAGETTVMTHGQGPDDYEVAANCQKCAGSGIATPPATSGMKESLVGDAERLIFMAHSPSRYVEQHPTNNMWRVYEDKAPATAVAADWKALTPDYHATPHMAIDAAIRAGRKG